MILAKRFLVGSSALIIGALALSGCSAGGATATKDGKVSMTLWQNSTTGPGQKFWDTAIKGFEAVNPGVTIKSQAVQNEDLDGKLQTSLNSGDAPDVFLQRGGGKMAAMVAAGQLMDLTASISADAKKEVPAGSFTANSVGSKVYAMPLSVLPGGLFYSKDLFAKAGVTTNPTTIDELKAANQKLRASGVEPIALGAKDAWPAAHWYFFFALRECSSKVLTDTAKSKNFSDKCWVRAGEDLKSFNATSPFNKGFLSTSAQQGAGSSAGLVANHLAAMELMGAWDPGVIASLTPDKQPLADLAWLPFPELAGGQGEPGAMMGGYDSYSCSATAPPECAKFLSYLVTPDQQTAYYKAFNAPPVNTVAQKAVTEPYLKQILESYNSAPFVSVWLDTLYGQNVGNALNVGVVDLLAGKSTPDQLVEAVNNAVKKA